MRIRSTLPALLALALALVLPAAASAADDLTTEVYPFIGTAN